MDLNLEKQSYKGIELTQCRRVYGNSKARRFRLYNSKHAIWIPCAYLFEDGTIRPNFRLEWLFDKPSNKNQLRLAEEVWKKAKGL